MPVQHTTTRPDILQVNNRGLEQDTTTVKEAIEATTNKITSQPGQKDELIYILVQIMIKLYLKKFSQNAKISAVIENFFKRILSTIYGGFFRSF